MGSAICAFYLQMYTKYLDYLLRAPKLLQGSINIYSTNKEPKLSRICLLLKKKKKTAETSGRTEESLTGERLMTRKERSQVEEQS